MASIKTLEDYNGNKIIPNTISDSVYIDEIGSGKETLKTRLNDIRAKLDTVNSSKVDRVELDSSTNELVFSAGINEIARITIATQSKNFTGLTLNSEDGKIYLADENGNAFGTGIKITGGAVEVDKYITGINLNFSSESLKVGKNIQVTLFKQDCKFLFIILKLELLQSQIRYIVMKKYHTPKQYQFNRKE